jgi:hypothetical protein
MLNELIAKIKQDVHSAEKSAESQMIVEQFKRSIEYLSTNDNSRFKEINL